jgi:hypothetical protein
MRAYLAICSRGFLGLITSDTKVSTAGSRHPDDVMWTGIHMTENRGKKIGDRWQSKAPKILCHLGHEHSGKIIAAFNDRPELWAAFPSDMVDINYIGFDGHWVEMVDGARWQWDGLKWVQA